MKIGFIGCGNMGKALINGIIKENVFSPDSINVYDIDKKKLEEIQNLYNLTIYNELENIVKNSQILILAVKPQDMDELLINLSKIQNIENKIIITIAAGLRISFYRKYLPKNDIVRVMPNTPALIGKGVSVLYYDGNFSESFKNIIKQIFESCGIVETVKKEELLDIVTGLSGSGPAYVYLFINALSDGGVLEGLPLNISRKIAAYTVLGAAEMALQSIENGIHFEELKDRVTSPGGTTARGLFALEENAFRGTVIKAVSEATKRAKELGGNK